MERGLRRQTTRLAGLSRRRGGATRPSRGLRSPMAADRGRLRVRVLSRSQSERLDEVFETNLSFHSAIHGAQAPLSTGVVGRGGQRRKVWIGTKSNCF